MPVEAVVIAELLLREVVFEVVVEVSAADESAELQDGLGAVEAPSGSCDLHSVLDQPSGRAFY